MHPHSNRLDKGDFGPGIVDKPHIELLISATALIEHLGCEAFAGTLLLRLLVVDDAWTTRWSHLTHHRKYLIRHTLWPLNKILNNKKI